MTVQNEIERALAMAEAAKGNYLLFATDSEDEKAEQVFKEMAEDMERHATILESRLDYLTQHNPLNGGSGKQGKQNKQDKQGKQGKKEEDGGQN